jgi:hypothetical protein
MSEFRFMLVSKCLNILSDDWVHYEQTPTRSIIIIIIIIIITVDLSKLRSYNRSSVVSCLLSAIISSS